MRPVVKGAIGVTVLVLATVVALQPRMGGDEPAPPSGDGVANEKLSAARSAANLDDCPTARTDRDAVPELAGVTATCLADGTTVRVGDTLAGELTLVNLWATWCAPCRDELRVLDTYADGSEAARVLGVQVASGKASGLRMLTELGVDLPVLHDGRGGRGALRAALDVPTTLPASYVISADGTVRFVERPRVFDGVEQVRAAVAEYGGSR